LDGQGSVSAADGINDAVVRHDAGADIAIDTVGPPQFFAGVGIDGNQPLLNADDQLLRLFRSRHDHRRIPRGADAGRAPQLLAGGLIQGNQGAAFDAGIDDDGIFVQDWRRARAPAVGVLAYQSLPNLFAFEIEAINARLAEEDVKAVAVD